MSGIELKACPFCGGKATLHERTERQHFSAADAAHSGMGQSAGSIAHTIREIHCECGIRVGGFRVAEMWNARAAQWQPIESVPHGKWVYVASVGTPCGGVAMLADYWINPDMRPDQYAERATHWMPLPAPPEVEG
ncbi:DUF551 domain-containing protein [Stenotrophomonas maltophilia]|nr:DUF551 domain-containing protein [Stenotrophomonas maltophilia]